MSTTGVFARDRGPWTSVIPPSAISAAERAAYRRWWHRASDAAVCPHTAWSRAIENYLPCMLEPSHPGRHAWVHRDSYGAEVW